MKPLYAMRTGLIGFLLVLVLFCSGCSGQSLETAESVEAFAGYLDLRVPKIMDRYNIPGVSMALIDDAEVAWTAAYGFADIKANREMKTNAVCRTESISKSVTAWGIMKLVEQNFVELDAPVEQYLDGWQLPETKYSEEEVTIRRLLSGTAGMPLGTIGAEAEYPPGSVRSGTSGPPDTGETSGAPSIESYLTEEARLIREPGSGFLYSNPGFNLLELLVEEVTGRNFAKYMAREILHPLGMENADFAWSDEFHDLIPMGYELDGTPVSPYVYAASASGGLFADVRDIARFVAAEMTGPQFERHGVLREESLRMIHTPQVEIPGMFGLVADSYGFGHFVELLPDGRKALWHGGQGHGWMTHFHAIPESGDGIVILTNSQRSWPLIAEVLLQWSKWLGTGPVKFSRIFYATTVFQVMVGIAALVLMWLVYRFVRQLVDGNRRFAPFSTTHVGVRALLAVLGATAIAALGWSVSQPYLFITSVFPGTATWAGLLALLFAVLFLVLAAFPRRKTEGRRIIDS